MSMDPALYLQYLNPTTAQTTVTLNGEVVGVRNRFGKGQAFLFGTAFGSPIGESDSANQKFLAIVLKHGGVEPDKAGSLIRRRRELDGKAAWFLFNPTRWPIEAEIALENFTAAEDLLGSAVAVENKSVRVNVGPLDICCLLLS